MDNSLSLAALILSVIALALPALFHLARYLGPRNHTNRAKEEAYESGISTPVGDTNERFSIQYYRVAIIFILFDIEVVFMLPWAVNLRDLGVFGLIEMFTFMGLLIAGLLYVYQKKGLKWT
ncbi:MAG: NADH-quinone oxidoreductase subunit A [Sulfuricurvum sp.]|uniref:NADH-quinone oxidoreductase subunit A n=1 Tax=Sulfuricurvum sp. TaxID=2025608 RepID=UPI0025E2F7FC|nr:NADH-quinone oxidoreductase subunit A [Sulfuricurvum sp.]MCK9371817.1 NADH-quinone oxidoreductase subunit A [Sulfuricurvum sp.]